MVEQLKANSGYEYRMHREVYRPWGQYDSIDAGARYQVKRITVKPGEAACRYRCIITAQNTGWWLRERQKSLLMVTSNCLVKMSPSIFHWGRHCLENPGKIPLEIIEVRSGSYLEEDDIVKFL